MVALSAAGYLALVTLLPAQGGFVRPGAPKIDPALPEPLMAVVKRATEAELDPQRGPQNALEILKAAKEEYPNSPGLLQALDLRIAGVIVRKGFLAKDDQPAPIRYEQAFSTYANLDLMDPGLKSWLNEVLKHHPYATKRLKTPEQRQLRVAVLVRGELDRQAIFKRFQATIAKTGFELVSVKAKEAHLIIKVAAIDDPQASQGKRAIKVILGLESIRGREVIWRHALYRTMAAPDVATALDGGLAWLARIGGRDLLFRWLGEQAFHSYLEKPTHEHNHPSHGNNPIPGQHSEHKDGPNLKIRMPSVHDTIRKRNR